MPMCVQRPLIVINCLVFFCRTTYDIDASIQPKGLEYPGTKGPISHIITEFRMTTSENGSGSWTKMTFIEENRCEAG